MKPSFNNYEKKGVFRPLVYKVDIMSDKVLVY